VFGSTARGEASPESDIDLLVTLEASRTLLDQIALWQDLEDLLNRKVDVVTESALRRFVNGCCARRCRYDRRPVRIKG
jgi:uncharacterized protein